MKPDTEQDYVEFVTHQANALCRTAYLLCGDWRRAEDATQEALIRLYRVWGRIQRKGAVAAYARKVVVSTTLDALRRKSSQEVVGGDDYFANQTDRADPLGVLENRLVITKALAELPPRDGEEPDATCPGQAAHASGPCRTLRPGCEGLR